MKKFLAMIVIAASLMSGCSKEDKASEIKEIYGVAASGAPIVGTVNIKGANGKVSMSAIKADGSFTGNCSFFGGKTKKDY